MKPERNLFAHRNNTSLPIRSGVLACALLVTMAAAGSAQQTSSALRGMEKENDALAWQAAGRLDSEEIGFCTATLISPEFILTAAHCVHSGETGEQIAPDSLTFRAGLRDGRVAAERRAVQIEAHAGYDPAVGLTAESARYDVALLRLDKAITTADLDPFVVSSHTMSTGQVSIVSYGFGRETYPSRQDVCEIKAARNGLMVMDCEATFGSSGAPVFSHANGRGQIVSVVSGGGLYDGQKVVYGMVLPEIVAELKQRMWANKARPVATINRVKIRSGKSDDRDMGAKFVRP